jgi:hypothetical protein
MFANLAVALALAQAAPAGIRVIGAEFYAFDEDAPEGTAVPTRIVPHRPESSCFAWVLRVAPADRPVRLREILILPAPTPSWDVGDAPTRVSPDRRRAETELVQDVSDGLASNEWCIADGDPVGPYRIEVYEDERLLHRFDFQVELETY